MSNERVVGLVREVRRYPEKRQRENLKDECGRIWSYEEIDLLFKYLRKGTIVIVCVAHCLGPSRAAIQLTMRRIFEKGGGIMVLEPETVFAKSGAEAADIALQAVAGLTGDKRAFSEDEAKRHGKKAWKSKAAKRDPIEKVRKFWYSKRGREMTVEERINQPEMEGWSITTFYRHLALYEAEHGKK